MDVLSITGLLLAAIAIILGAILKGAGIHALVSSAAFMIVVVGTVAAICVQTPMEVMKRALTMFPWILRPPSHDPVHVIRLLRPGVLSLAAQPPKGCVLDE